VRVRPEDDPSLTFGAMAELLASTTGSLEERLSYCLSNPLDKANHPVMKAMVDAYISRLQLALDNIRRGAIGLRYQYENHPHLTDQIQELESWLFHPKPRESQPKITTKQEETIGDWLVGTMRYSYSKARRQIESFKRSISTRGAPSKRVETLLMMDARISNGWSYPTLASRMCDCGGSDHGVHCSERIRKRIKELEGVLKNYGIPLHASEGGEK
jgi:hypothetical protein